MSAVQPPLSFLVSTTVLFCTQTCYTYAPRRCFCAPENPVFCTEKRWFLHHKNVIFAPKKGVFAPMEGQEIAPKKPKIAPQNDVFAPKRVFLHLCKIKKLHQKNQKLHHKTMFLHQKKMFLHLKITPKKWHSCEFWGNLCLTKPPIGWWQNLEQTRLFFGPRQILARAIFLAHLKAWVFLFLGLLRAPTRNSPERVRDTIWTFPEKSGKPPGLETPRFSFSQDYVGSTSVFRISLLRVITQGQTLAVWMLAAKLPNADQNVAVDFLCHKMSTKQCSKFTWRSLRRVPHRISAEAFCWWSSSDTNWQLPKNALKWFCLHKLRISSLIPWKKLYSRRCWGWTITLRELLSRFSGSNWSIGYNWLRHW